MSATDGDIKMGEEYVITVLNGPPREGQLTDFAAISPVISVWVACDADWTPESPILPKHNAVRYMALLDTGSEGIAVDARIAKDIGVAATERAIVHGLNESKEVDAANVQIVLCGHNIVISGRVAITSLGGAGHTFGVVLGRSFLRHCRFSVNGPLEEYSLCWVE
jgi:predicted aspartyl protease